MDEIDTALSVLLSLRIANLGYAVGMGQPPNPKTVREIARAARLTVLRGMLQRGPTEATIATLDELLPYARGTETHRLAGGQIPEDYWRAMLSAEVGALEKEGRTS